MAKPSWTPSPDQKKMLAALKRAHRRIAEAETAYRTILSECAEAEIPILHMSEELGVERKTIYRHLGRSMT